ncbi:hypothetical protein DEO48_26460 [Enterobacter sp. CGMCC 5087]|nr:hypothetical protein DEO48_26460 [Enterobacter sp. CGMCC 5087]
MSDLLRIVGLGLIALLPLVNPLTTVALFLGLSGGMSPAQRRSQILCSGQVILATVLQ